MHKRKKEVSAMGKLLATLKRVRFVYRRSNNMTKTVVIAALLLSMAALLVLHGAITAAEKQLAEKRALAAQLEQERDKLNESIGSLGSAESVDQIAQDKLGLVDPDSIVITPNIIGSAIQTSLTANGWQTALIWILVAGAVLVVALPVMIFIMKRNTDQTGSC